jgi:microcompartment protein CcmK/EutM
MLLGRVHGSAVCTIKYPGTEGLKLMIVQPLNRNLEAVGGLQVAADTVQAGPGDLCVMVRAREASLALPERSLCRSTWRWWALWMSWRFGRMAVMTLRCSPGGKEVDSRKRQH